MARVRAPATSKHPAEKTAAQPGRRLGENAWSGVLFLCCETCETEDPLIVTASSCPSKGIRLWMAQDKKKPAILVGVRAKKTSSDGVGL